MADNHLLTSVYHKLDSFKFLVILLRFLNSLIANQMGFNVYARQFLRYLRICSYLDYFIKKTKSTIILLESKGVCNKSCVQYQMEKSLSGNSQQLDKFEMCSVRQISPCVGLC